jgi:hypothetical protein
MAIAVAEGIILAVLALAVGVLAIIFLIRFVGALWEGFMAQLAHIHDDAYIQIRRGEAPRKLPFRWIHLWFMGFIVCAIFLFVAAWCQER